MSKPPDWSNWPANCPCCRFNHFQCRFRKGRAWNSTLGDICDNYQCNYCNSIFVWDHLTGEVRDIQSLFHHWRYKDYEKTVEIVHQMVEVNDKGIRAYAFTTWNHNGPSYIRGYIRKEGRQIVFKHEETGEEILLDAKTGRGEKYKLDQEDLLTARKELRAQLCARRVRQSA